MEWSHTIPAARGRSAEPRTGVAQELRPNGFSEPERLAYIGRHTPYLYVKIRTAA